MAKKDVKIIQVENSTETLGDAKMAEPANALDFPNSGNVTESEDVKVNEGNSTSLKAEDQAKKDGKGAPLKIKADEGQVKAEAEGAAMEMKAIDRAKKEAKGAPVEVKAEAEAKGAPMVTEPATSSEIMAQKGMGIIQAKNSTKTLGDAKMAEPANALDFPNSGNVTESEDVKVNERNSASLKAEDRAKKEAKGAPVEIKDLDIQKKAEAEGAPMGTEAEERARKEAKGAPLEIKADEIQVKAEAEGTPLGTKAEDRAKKEAKGVPVEIQAMDVQKKAEAEGAPMGTEAGDYTVTTSKITAKKRVKKVGDFTKKLGGTKKAKPAKGAPVELKAGDFKEEVKAEETPKGTKAEKDHVVTEAEAGSYTVTDETTLYSVVEDFTSTPPDPFCVPPCEYISALPDLNPTTSPVLGLTTYANREDRAFAYSSEIPSGSNVATAPSSVVFLLALFAVLRRVFHNRRN